MSSLTRIKLTKGKYAIVDDEDYPYLNRFRWVYNKGVFATILRDKMKYVEIPMGHFILRPNRKYNIVNHINGDDLDFRKSNLILIREGKRTHRGRKRKTHFGKLCTSKYKGVSLNRLVWRVTIQKDKRSYYLGKFRKEKDAARAYNEKAKELYGELAYQNKI